MKLAEELGAKKLQGKLYDEMINKKTESLTVEEIQKISESLIKEIKTK